MNLVSKMHAGQRAILLASTCGWLLAGTVASAADDITFVVDGATETIGVAIDTGSDVAGTWYDSSFVSHGFLRTADGTITPFDPPGSTGTNVYGLNDNQWIVGSFSDGSQTHGFVRAADGTITVYDAPGGTGYTEIYGINKSNAFAGTYAASDGNDYAFVLSSKGRFKSFAAPDGGRYAYATAINAKNETAGAYVGADSITHGFVRTREGVLTSFDVPGADEPFVRSINAKGAVAGNAFVYPDSNSGHGYVRLADGTIQTFQVVSGFETDAYGLNVHGVSCGEYYDAGGHYHGFVRTARSRASISELSARRFVRRSTIAAR
jgi:hypothetical protein